MSTRELIEVEMQGLDETQLRELYQVARKLAGSGKNASQPSLMAKLKQVQIEAPEDFAANLDLYTAGEKRVE